MGQEISKFYTQLRRQLFFLSNSCRLFDMGCIDEAIRIATSIRVLLHDTSQSTSLLTHLNSKNIKIFDSCPIHEKESGDGTFCITGFAMGVIKMNPKKKIFGYGPLLDDYNPHKSILLPLEEWWNRNVWILTPKLKLNRKNIILCAANKDGGAHVDKDLEPAYEYLSKGSFGAIYVNYKGVEHKQSIENMHLVSIRTISNELLKSPDMINLFKQATASTNSIREN